MPRRRERLFDCAILVLLAAACAQPAPAPAPTSAPPTALYRVTNGPYPLYETDGEWLTGRAAGVSLVQVDEQIMAARRQVLVERRVGLAEGAWLHDGCLFDVQRTTPDTQDPSYVWAFGTVVRCDEPVANGPPEPQMGVRARQIRIFDGLAGYFPMRLLAPYTGSPPGPRSS